MTPTDVKADVREISSNIDVLKTVRQDATLEMAVAIDAMVAFLRSRMALKWLDYYYQAREEEPRDAPLPEKSWRHVIDSYSRSVDYYEQEYYDAMRAYVTLCSRYVDKYASKMMDELYSMYWIDRGDDNA